MFWITLPGYYESDWALTKIVRDGESIIICTEGNSPVQMQRMENWTDEQWEKWEQPPFHLFEFQDLDECVVHCGWFEAETLSSNAIALATARRAAASR